MRIFLTPLIFAAVLSCGTLQAQSDNEQEQLKLAAIEALMAAPPEKALPIVKKVMNSNNSDELKTRALFILSQIDMPEAHQLLLDTARNSEGELQQEAIRMIGISGNPALTSQLQGLYESGDPELRESVLHAYVISGDADTVYQLALNASSDEEFEEAVQILGVMGATEHLRSLRDRPGTKESLIHAYAISGDTDSLLALAKDTSNPDQQMQAIHGLGIAGGNNTGDALLEIYHTSDNREVRQAVMHGLMVAGNDEAILELYRSSTDSSDKADLLRLLVMMDSDAAMEAIDAALSGEQ